VELCIACIVSGELSLSVVPVICRHLGQELGLMPASLADQLKAEQLTVRCHEFLVEGRWLKYTIKYSENCVQQPHKGSTKSSCLEQVAA